MKALEINNNHNEEGNKLILSVIPYGEDNALTMKEVARVLNVKQRVVRNLLEQARLDGNVIAGTDAGMFIPLSYTELRSYVRRSQARIRSSIKTLNPAASLLSSVENDLEDVDNED